MKKIFNIFTCCIMTLLLIAPISYAFDEEKEHIELRALLTKVVELVNSNKLDELDNYVDTKSFVMITADGQIFTNAGDVKKYWQSIAKPDGNVKKITINPKPSLFTNFLSEKSGVAIGNSIDTYDFGNDNLKQMKMFWTVVVVKVDDRWKISKIHYSASIFDNLVLDYQKRTFIGKMFW